MITGSVAELDVYGNITKSLEFGGAEDGKVVGHALEIREIEGEVVEERFGLVVDLPIDKKDRWWRFSSGVCLALGVVHRDRDVMERDVILIHSIAELRC